MPKANADFAQTFATLRGILQAYEKKLLVLVNKPGDYQIASGTRKDRIGRPLFVAAVQIKKSYVGYHLLPLYANPKLLREVPPELRKRMQGKACFNFTSIEPGQKKELAALTRRAVASFQNVKLPWE